MAKKSRAIDMTKGPLFSKIWGFAFPFMLSSLLQQLYHAADVVVVGRYAGQEALAGVGTTGALITLILNFFLGLSAGVSVTLGKALGEKEEKSASEIVHTSVLLAIVCGVFVSLIGFIFTPQLLQFIDVPASVMPYAQQYMSIAFCGQIFVLIFNFGSAVLTAKGDSKRPLYIVTASGIINVLLNLFFVIKLNMASGGVALATVISQLFTAVTVLWILSKENDCTRLYFKKLMIYKNHLKNIAVVGVPAGIQSTIFSFSNVIIQSSVNSFNSAAAIAGSAASGSIEGFFYVLFNAFFQASMAFVSQNMGAKKAKRIKKTVLYCLLSVGIIWVCEIFVVSFMKRFLLGIYLPGNEEAISWGLIRLTIIVCTYGLLGCTEVMSGALRGIGHSFISMITTIAGVCGIRLVWIAIAFKKVKTFEVLFASYPISWIVTFLSQLLLFIILFKKVEKSFEKELSESVIE